MAITNAQQFKQLVNPPMDNKRPGYRGEAAAASDAAAGRSAKRRARLQPRLGRRRLLPIESWPRL